MRSGRKAEGAAGEKGGIFGKAWRGVKFAAVSPVRALAAGEIVSGARWIGELAGNLKKQVWEDKAFRVLEDRRIDMEATAFLHGISIDQLEYWLVVRRRQTAKAAYLAFGLGWLFFAGWLYRAATMPWTSGHILPEIEFAPFCVAFFLIAFRNALVNFQIRTRWLAGAGEYLRTEEPFWPR